MFIKLTKLDNSPVWLNASFIVTVEPRKGGGSIVVPIGDGLDYDVRERCEDVLAKLEGAPIPKVVPIPVSDCLTKTPADVSPEPEPRREIERAERFEKKAVVVEEKNVADSQVAEAPKPAEPDKTSESEADKSAEGEAGKPADAGVAPEAEPNAKKTARKTRAKAKTAKEPKPTTVKKTRTTRAKKPTLDLSEEEVIRLRKMAPGSVNKLKNTLYTQFHVEDPSKTMLALEAHGILSLDRDHIVWAAPVDKSANN